MHLAVADAEETPAALGTVLAGKWSLATALALLAWYVFAPQCVATLGVIRRETNSRVWVWVTFGYMIALAYAAAFVTFHMARALGGG